MADSDHAQHHRERSGLRERRPMTSSTTTTTAALPRLRTLLREAIATREGIEFSDAFTDDERVGLLKQLDAVIDGFERQIDRAQRRPA